MLYSSYSNNRISLLPNKRLLPAKVSLQRHLALQSDNRKQSSRHSLKLIVALLAVLRELELSRIEINATANSVARAVWLAVRLSGIAFPSVKRAIISMVRPRTTRREVALGLPAWKIVVSSAEGTESDGHEGIFGLVFVICEVPRGDFEVVSIEACR